MIDGLFMSRRSSIAVAGGEMDFSIEIIHAPVFHKESNASQAGSFESVLTNVQRVSRVEIEKTVRVKMSVWTFGRRAFILPILEITDINIYCTVF